MECRPPLFSLPNQKNYFRSVLDGTQPSHFWCAIAEIHLLLCTSVEVEFMTYFLFFTQRGNTEEALLLRQRTVLL